MAPSNIIKPSKIKRQSHASVENETQKDVSLTAQDLLGSDL